jgi:hypothetical protein
MTDAALYADLARTQRAINWNVLGQNPGDQNAVKAWIS